MIEVRALTPDDWPTWRELRLAALAQAPYAFGSRLADWQGDGDREARWRERLELPGSHNLVVLLDGRPVGMAAGIRADPESGADDPTSKSPDDSVAELISMWVAPHARGRGVADLLVRCVEAWARQSGATRLRLAVTPGNEHALSLYRRNGFADTGEPGDLMSDGVHRETIMAKALRER